MNTRNCRVGMVSLLVLLGLWLGIGCGKTGRETADEQILASIPDLDPRAIVVLGYLDHQHGMVDMAKWPCVAFAIGDGTLLLTAAHCVEAFRASSGRAPSTDIVVISPYYGDVFDFDVVAADKKADVAILRAPWTSHPALTLATEQELFDAESLLIVGRPQAGEISGDIRIELVPVSGVNEAVPSRAVTLKGARLIAKGWSGSAMLIPETGRVGGVLTQLQEGSVRRAFFFRSTRLNAMGCSIRSIYSLLRQHGLETAALGRPAHVKPIADGERAFSAAIRCAQALFETDRDKLTDSVSELTRLRPRSVQVHLLAALAAILSGSQSDVVESSYKRAVEIDPNHAHAHAVYGDFLLARGRRAEARVQCDAALAIDPNNRLALFNRLVLSPSAQRRGIAERLVTMDPNDPFWWFHYSATLCHLGQRQEALQAAQKAVDLDPNGLYYGGLADALAELGRVDEAEPYYKRMTERCGCEQCWYKYAAFLVEHRGGRRDEALQAFQMAESKAGSGRVPQKDIEMLRLRLMGGHSLQETEALAGQVRAVAPNSVH
jgi:tetratricopeptide (TPR) repeat protein